MTDLIEFLRAQLDDAEADIRRAAEIGQLSVPDSMGDLLADVDAKRRILDGIANRLDARDPEGGWESADAETDGMASTTLRLLALPYADREGYRSEWAP